MQKSKQVSLQYTGNKRGKMKKSTKISLIFGIVMIVGCLFIGFFYPFGGISLLTRYNYISNHKDDLHLRGDYHYKLTKYKELDLFSSFAIIEFESENELTNLELVYARDDNFQRYKNLTDSTSQTVFEQYLDYLPFDLNCDCYTLFVINQFQFDGGYFYHVYSFENRLYIFYASR